MPTTRSLLDHPRLNGWYLFGWLFSLVCAVVLVGAWRADLSQGAGVSALIALSVQASVPSLYLAFSASSLAALFPHGLTRWLLRNRRYLGLTYAAGMGWQLVFIFWLVSGHIDYYHQVADNPYDLAEELPGYLLLIALTVTSFRAGRRSLSNRQWKILHTLGIYYLWGETWSTYWAYCFYYEDPAPIHTVYFLAGLAAWGARMLAWTRRELRAAATAGDARP